MTVRYEIRCVGWDGEYYNRSRHETPEHAERVFDELASAVEWGGVRTLLLVRTGAEKVLRQVTRDVSGRPFGEDAFEKLHRDFSAAFAPALK